MTAARKPGIFRPFRTLSPKIRTTVNALLTINRKGLPESLLWGEAKGVIMANSLKRSEEHTSELQSLMRISYAVFCLKKKTQQLEYDQRYNSENIITTNKP